MLNAISIEDVHFACLGMVNSGARPTRNEVCKRLGYSVAHFSRQFPSLSGGVKFSDYARLVYRDRMVEMAKSGMTRKQLMDKFGLSYWCVSTTLNRAGYYVNDKGE